MSIGLPLALRSLIVGSGLSLALLSGCGSKDQAGGPPSTSLRAVRLQTGTFKPGNNYISSLQSTEVATVRPQIQGRIVRIIPADGSPISKGELIAELDDGQQQAQYQQALAESKLAKVTAERTVYLWKNGAASSEQRDQDVSAAAAAAENAANLKADLAYKFLRSPIDGILGDILPEVGDVLDANDPLVTVASNKRLWTRLAVPSSLAYRVRLGQEVELTAPGNPPLRKTGRISFVAPNVDPQSQTLLLKAVFDNTDGSLRTGQVVKTRLISSQLQALSVPVSAVNFQAGQAFVFRILEANVALRELEKDPSILPTLINQLKALAPTTLVAVQTPIQLGVLENNQYPLVKGLNPGDLVATSNTSNLQTGSVVTISKTPIKQQAS